MSHVEEGTLHAMLDGELTGEEVAAVKAHLDQCARCRALLDEVKEFVAEADTLIVALDEHTAPAEEGGQAGGRAVGRYGGNVRPWYRRPQFLATAATLTLAIGAGYIGLALRDQGMLTDQPELLSEADAPVVGHRDSGAAGAVGQLRGDLGKERAAKDELAAAGEARKRAEPSVAALELEEEQPAPADLAAPADDDDGLAGGRIANEGNVPALAAPAAPAAPAGVADADEAMSRLGASIKLIAGRRPVRIEQEPAPTLEGVTATGGLVRVVYQDEEDREFVLEQVKVSFDNDAADDKRNRAAEPQKAAAAFAERETFLRITPNDTVISAETDSTVRIRWIDADGILLALIGVDEEFLREMMGRIR
ncbi:MAG: hypothetical protein E2O47_06005 [Gemmatimonadetes bacterium]|nr:MAG: hypothetical protein E2O47_06005 [Gemmatimonadota bacterium]